MEDGVDNPLLLWRSAPSRQISRNRLVDLNQRRLLVDDMKLVLVRELVVASPQLSDSLIVLVQNGGVPMTMAVSSICFIWSKHHRQHRQGRLL